MFYATCSQFQRTIHGISLNPDGGFKSCNCPTFTYDHIVMDPKFWWTPPANILNSAASFLQIPPARHNFSNFYQFYPFLPAEFAFKCASKIWNCPIPPVRHPHILDPLQYRHMTHISPNLYSIQRYICTLTEQL